MIARNKHLLFWILSTVILSGCSLFDSGSKHIVGRYMVLWIDEPQNLCLSLQDSTNSSGSTEIILPYVFAVGHNNRFIIAKQHPTNGFEGRFKMDTTVTHYFIIDIKKKSKFDDYTLYGPLTLTKFKRLCIRFDLQNVPFDIQYPDNIYPTIRLPDSLGRH